MITIKNINRFKIPYFYILNKKIRFWDIGYYPYLRRILEFNKLVKKYEDDIIILKDGFKLNIEFAELMAREYPDWGYYLPPYNLRNKVILDIGAGCGETARYYLLNGALKVICIDNDDICLNYLKINSKNFNIDIIGESFKLEHLKLNYDICKMDIEGYEVLLINAYDNGLLNIKELKPMIIECHSQYCINRFKEMGFRIVHRYRSDLKIMSNW